MTNTRVDQDVLAKMCDAARPLPGHEALVRAVNEGVPGLDFHMALTGKPWYRLGGLIDIDGKHISNNLEEWVETESYGDVVTLIDRHGGASYFATKILGRTHYLVARTGPRTLDFAQIEVEQTQEVIDRPLFHSDWVPDNIEDIIDPLDFPEINSEPLTLPQYHFRRLTKVARRQAELHENHREDRNFDRFVEDWDHSSAGDTARFSDHWVLTMVPYLDASGEHHDEVHPLTTYQGTYPDMTDQPRRGAPLARLVHDFDVEVGFPMAWFFFMLTSSIVPDRIGQAVHQDHQSGYSYLTPADATVVARWLEQPYQLYHPEHL